MLSRASIHQTRHLPVRGFASAQALRQRIQAIKNIKKITTAMKVVATVKLRAAQEALAVARFFQHSVFNLVKPVGKLPSVKKQLWVGMSSDRGLCGGINSTISRGIRDSILEAPADVSDRGIVLYGEKSRAGLNSQFGNLFRATLSDCDKNRPVTFYQCAELADYWLRENADKSLFFFQKFKSMIAYITTVDEFYSYDYLKDSLETSLALYETEGPDDTFRNLVEFTAAVKLFHYFSENNASTLSARMQAMGNSSTNANDMIATLTLYLNRSRQAKITTELSEIVGGAAAVDEELAGADTDDIIPRNELQELEEELGQKAQASA
jgi:F-type H+-transporting ATPase subunit gamma